MKRRQLHGVQVPQDLRHYPPVTIWQAMGENPLAVVGGAVCVIVFLGVVYAGLVLGLALL